MKLTRQNYPAILAETKTLTAEMVEDFNQEDWSAGHAKAARIAALYYPDGDWSTDRLAHLLIHVASDMYHGAVIHSVEERSENP